VVSISAGETCTPEILSVFYDDGVSIHNTSNVCNEVVHAYLDAVYEATRGCVSFVCKGDMMCSMPTYKSAPSSSIRT
jgi:hypothetical protein